ncbi:flagellar basal-body rod protein FlgF [Simiduia sp. 21SJ11W-1]|uniref:flagellar basal-body rod protein FlgF n=1 Tax=Simiduia sp. 21SJ11W-1 TaxID=2909669 RepID=UPI0020A0033F|nr:flagellar basal-body rod protein FlgF [Simiduia sp. 21SJ11W-1]UTA49463.1 flagellar basal-body rod protein FlgF [Simiduia sp. 21SJ11W-1]
MDKALYVSMTAAKHNMRAQTAHSNNLANINTHGFKADFAQARAMPVFYGDGHPTRAYALTESPATDFAHGAFIETGRELDVAINGDGFLAVQLPDGREAYTRAGNLLIDADGILRNSEGMIVLGDGGPIALPPQEKVEVGLDGSISIINAGEGPQTPAQIARLRLVNPDVANLEKDESGYFVTRDGEAAAVDANVQVTSGFLEASNVNAMHEFTSVLTLARQYELHVKLMGSVQENSEASARMLQIS